MTEKSYTLNKVDGFNPYDELTEMYDSLGQPIISPLTEQQRLHLRVDAKKTWFRKVYPEGATTLEIVSDDDVSVVVKACVYKTTDTDQFPLGCGFSSQDKVGNRTYPPLESAATIALGNALEDAGFGCEIMQEIFKEETNARNAKAGCYEAALKGADAIDDLEETVIEAEFDEAPVVKPVKEAAKTADEASDDESSEDMFAALGVETPTSEGNDEKEEASDHTEPSAQKKRGPKRGKKKVEKEDAEAKISNDEEDVNDENTETSTENTEPDTTDVVNDPGTYIIKMEDNITGSTYLAPFIGKALNEIEPKTLKLMHEKLALYMSKELIDNIKQLI